LEDLFREIDCVGALHVRELATGAEVALNADKPVAMASTFKAIVALEFFSQVRSGEIDPTKSVEFAPPSVTPGPTGISLFRDAVRLSLRDQATLMMTISDNTAADSVVRVVGLDKVNARAERCGCVATAIFGDIQGTLDSVGKKLGFDSYSQLLDAQSGRLGEAARLQSTDRDRIATLSEPDLTKVTHTTARDMTTFLSAVWRDEGADPAACADLRRLMEMQLTRRLESAVPDGGKLAAKSGSLFGRIRNEIGVISYPDGKAYAAAIFTRASRPFVGAARINAQMGVIVDRAVHMLR
jgi:beta-lactamase class A